MITFSGIDCAGKSTQIARLREWCDQKGIESVVVWSRPGFTPGIAKLKTLLRGKKGGATEEAKEIYREKVRKTGWKNKLYLQLSLWDMIFYYGITLRCMEKKGTVLLCDRYLQDARVDLKLRYQDYDFEKLCSWRLLQKVAKKPAVSFLFTIPAEEAIRRAKIKGEIGVDSDERRQMRMGYYEEQRQAGAWSHVVDCMRSIEEIAADVIGVVGDVI